MIHECTASWLVRKRDGRVVPFEAKRIAGAIACAFRAELALSPNTPLPKEITKEIEELVRGVVQQLAAPASSPQGADVELIQDRVEMELMARGHFAVARRYIVYRAERSKVRALRGDVAADNEQPSLRMILEDGRRVPFDAARVRQPLEKAAEGLSPEVDLDGVTEEVLRTVFDGIEASELDRALILAARARIEQDPAYDRLAARLLLQVIYLEALGSRGTSRNWSLFYAQQFEHFLVDGLQHDRLSSAMRDFDWSRLAAALVPERDERFRYLGLQTIYDRYLLQIDGRRIETPQYFWMRVAMGLALREDEDRESRAIEFYHLLSTFRFTSATPTLFNAGTPHPQLSSCYLSTVSDDLEQIFKCISDNAKLSKWAGGLGNDWTPVRATNAPIRGTHGLSQGVIPFLKVVNDAAVAVNQGGKRKGAVCAYLETWHLDMEEFLDLRKNTGDDRRRTHDMHTANWIPDLFLERVLKNGTWTLFSPDEVPDLHDLYGPAFRKRYEQYEAMADRGEIRLYRRVSAVDLWRKMLTRLYETGHPWITFKDPANLRSPQDHVGVVHSSNLCTEILLNTSPEETAVCNLGSVNLAAHIRDGEIDETRLAETVRTAVRMLDNVIDINFYPIPEARRANMSHRPIGLGIMGFQNALDLLGISYASPAAVEFADRSMELVSFHAILASTELAAERGTYASYAGSKWDRGLLPIDTWRMMHEQRGTLESADTSETLPWEQVRDAVARYGMRNSNVLAIAPTATISTIVGTSQSIEPTYRHLYAKSNLSGEFTQINEALVEELKEHGLWNDALLEELKYHSGILSPIERIPADIRERFLTAFEIDPHWLIECAARRQKWIDQGQSLNLYLAKPSGRKLHDMYVLAWQKGLKTTYYLRTLAATQVEPSTVDINRFGIQPKWMKHRSASSSIQVSRSDASICRIDDPDCEACQ